MFLNPLLSIGVAAAAIPIIIHLLNNRQVKQMEWAAMRFLRVSVEKNRKRKTIEDILLMILRCALLALLALTLARPVLGNRWLGGHLPGGGATTAVVIVDSSYSMTATDGVHSVFDQAKQLGAQVIDGLGSGSKAAVWLSSDAADPLIAEPTPDLQLARATLTSARPTDRATNALPALRDAVRLLHASNASSKEVDFITDGQSSGWKQVDDIRRMLGEATDVTANIFLLPSSPTANLTLADLRPAGDLILAHRPLRFLATVRNNGTSDVHDSRVTLHIDGGPPVSEATVASLAAGESAAVSMTARFDTEGTHTITAALPADHLPADDSRTIAVRVRADLKVLLVDGSGRRDRDSATFYLQRLLGAGGEIGTTTIPPGEVDHQALEQYAVVALADVPSLSQHSVDQLNNYVHHGGGLLVFPGPDIDPTFYNDELVAKHHLLPGVYGEATGQADAKERLIAFQATGFAHPIAEIWSDSAAGSPASVNVFRYQKLVADAGTTEGIGAAQTVLNFSDNSPAILERTVGRGRTIQFAVPANAAWDDLPLHPGVFVPLIFRSVESIIGRQDDALNVPAGGTLVLHPPSQSLNQQATVVRPGDDPHAAPQSLPVQLVDGEATISDSQTDRAGAYVVTVPDSPTVRFAVQSDPAESLVQPMPDDVRRALGRVAQVVDYNGGEANVARAGGSDRELWRLMAMVVLAIAAVEMGCAAWFSRAK